MVELLAEPHRIGPALVEGEVDHRALRPQGAKCRLQALGMGAGLEHEVGAAVIAAMVPTLLGQAPGLLLCHGLETERFGALPPKPRRVGHEHLGGPALLGEERRQKSLRRRRR